MDAMAVLNRISETNLHAFEAEHGEVLSEANKNLMKLVKHAFDAGAYTNVASRQYRVSQPSHNSRKGSCIRPHFLEKLTAKART
jgi:hypothetical protein